MVVLQRSLCVLALVWGAVHAAFLAKKPAFLTTCYFKDPQFEECSLKQLQVLFSRLLEGFPEIGSPPLDPLDVTEISVVSGGEGPVSVNSTLSQVRVHGLSKSKVFTHRLNPQKLTLDSELLVPALRIEGKYQLKGRLLALPITGNGDVTFEPENMNVSAHHELSLVEHEGHRFLHIDNSKVNFTVGGLKMHFTNLFNGQKALEESTNQYLNENWQVTFDSLRPALEDTIQDLLKTIIGRLLDKVPVDYFVGDI